MYHLYNTFFGPLNSDACVYFLFMSALFFVILILVLASEIIYIFSSLYSGRKFTFRDLRNGILILCNLFLAYFVNRLFYTMCAKSLA
jgi:hypothetical protein